MLSPLSGFDTVEPAASAREPFSTDHVPSSTDAFMTWKCSSFFWSRLEPNRRVTNFAFVIAINRIAGSSKVWVTVNCQMIPVPPTTADPVAILSVHLSTEERCADDIANKDN